VWRLHSRGKSVLASISELVIVVFSWAGSAEQLLTGQTEGKGEPDASHQ